MYFCGNACWELRMQIMHKVRFMSLVEVSYGGRWKKDDMR